MTIGTVGPVSIAGTIIPGIMSSTINPGILEQGGGSSGDTSRTYNAKIGQDAGATFSTHALESAGTLCALNGYRAITIAEPLIIYALTRVVNGETETTCTAYTFTEGLLVASGTQGGHRGPYVTQQYTMFASSETGSIPFTVATGIAVPAPVPGTEFYTIGGVEVNGITYEQVQQINFDPGFDVRQIGGSGLVFPQISSVNRSLPTLTASMIDTLPGADGEVTLEGVTTTSASILFRRMELNGEPIVTGGITVSMAAGRAKIENISHSNDSESDLSLTMTPTDPTIGGMTSVSIAS